MFVCEILKQNDDAGPYVPSYEHVSVLHFPDILEIFGQKWKRFNINLQT